MIIKMQYFFILMMYSHLYVMFIMKETSKYFLGDQNELRKLRKQLSALGKGYAVNCDYLFMTNSFSSLIKGPLSTFYI